MKKKTEKHSQPIEGMIRVNGRGEGTLYLPDGTSAQVDNADLNTALDGDTVSATIVKIKKETKAQVTKVVTRKRMEFVGVIEPENGVFFVVPEDRRVYNDILVMPQNVGGAKNGDMVLVKIEKWDDPRQDPLGKVLRVLGRPGDNDVEMESIVLEKGFRPEFPAAVDHEAEEAKRRASQNFSTELA